MRLALLTALLPAAALGSVAAPPRSIDDYPVLSARENLCSLRAPPQLCTPNASVTVEETAIRAYKFYRAFVVDGDPRTMFSLIDNVYKQHNPGYSSGPQVIWPLFCSGRKIGTEQATSWCFDASTNMSYARYSVTDRWRWVDGCVHEHWDQGERMPSADKCYKLPADFTYP
jgi:predicted SnoaL-like aldol condensation-catalyzing enzyme